MPHQLRNRLSGRAGPGRVAFISEDRFAVVRFDSGPPRIEVRALAGPSWRRWWLVDRTMWSWLPSGVLEGIGASLVLGLFPVALFVGKAHVAPSNSLFHPAIELATGALMWLLPALLGQMLRATSRGRQWLRLHGAEHHTVANSLVTPRCGSVVYARGVVLATWTMVVVSVAGPDLVDATTRLAAERAWLIRATVFASAVAAASLFRWPRLDKWTAWLQLRVILPPEDAEVAACRAAVEALKTGVVPERYAVAVEKKPLSD